MVEKRLHVVFDGDGEQDARSAGVIKAIWTLLDTLPPAERQRVQQQIADFSPPSAPKKGGDVLGVVLKLIPKRGDWLIEDLKKKVLERTEYTKPKEIYNAVGYLARRGYIRRISYGRYLTEDGQYFVTSDDCGGQPSITESDLDD